MIRRLIVTFLLLAGPPAAYAEIGAWNFRVLLDGREIGRHQFSLRDAGEGQELRSEAQFDVRLLFFSAYSYLHEAVERWDGNCLQSLVARTETNGESLAVSAATGNGRLAVERPEGRDLHEGCVKTFAYWNPQILNSTLLLNSQTGEMVPVKITAQGRDTVAVRGQPVAADRHRISGPGMQIDLWYAADQWIALEALTEGGRRLRYELK
jgi:hypothetical protein